MEWPQLGLFTIRINPKGKIQLPLPLINIISIIIINTNALIGWYYTMFTNRPALDKIANLDINFPHYTLKGESSVHIDIF